MEPLEAINSAPERKMDFELSDRVSAAGLTEDGRFEFDGEIVGQTSSCLGSAVFWLWVSDDDCDLNESDDEEKYHKEREAAYTSHALKVGAPLGDVDGYVSIGEDAGSYVRVFVDMAELVETVEFIEGCDDDDEVELNAE